MTPKEEMDVLRRELGLLGCGDHGCCVSRPIGMGTNGGCRCLDTLHLTPERRIKLRRALQIRQRQVEIMEKVLRGFDELL